MDGFHPDALGDRNRRCSHDTPRKGHPVTIAFKACTAHKGGAGAVQGHRTATLEVERGGAYSGSSATMAASSGSRRISGMRLERKTASDGSS